MGRNLRENFCVLWSTGDNRPYPKSTAAREKRQPKRSLDGLLQVLLAAEIPLGGQHGHVTKQELNLFQFAATHMAGGELEQIQFLPGHVSIETTERYLGCKQRFQNALNDAIGLEPGG